MDLVMLNDNILVSEITEDIMCNGTVTMYDAEAPYMFCKVERVEANSVGIDVGSIVVIKRYAKEEFLPGYYFISIKDVRCVVPEETFNNLVVKN